MERHKLLLPILMIFVGITAQAQDDDEVYLIPEAAPQLYLVPANSRTGVAAGQLAEKEPILITIENNSNYDIDMVSLDAQNINLADIRLMQDRTLYPHTTNRFVVGRTGYPANLFIGFAISSQETEKVNKRVGQWEYIEYEHTVDSCHNYGSRPEQETTVTYVPNQTYNYPTNLGYAPYYYSPYPYYGSIAPYAYPANQGYTAIPSYNVSTPFSIRCSGNNNFNQPIVEILLQHI